MISSVLALAVLLLGAGQGQEVQQRVDLDFSKAEEDPETGQLCFLQQVCLANQEELAKRLPQEPCFPEGCNCNTDDDCGGQTPFCAECKCSRFPTGCNCKTEDDCGGAFCINCNCSPFPPGCNCMNQNDCGGDFCVNCQCSRFPPGCNCMTQNDCGGDFCVNCKCSPFPPGCSCNMDSDCGNGNFCNNCMCSRFPPGCNCNMDSDCGANGFCNNCMCGRFPPGCNCNMDSDCGANGFCNDCQCSRFPPGCNCNMDSDCGSNGFCNDCQCSRFPPGCNCNMDGDCGTNGFCNDCQCSRFPPGCTCNTDSDCGGQSPFCADCQCSQFPPGCNCDDNSDCGPNGFCQNCQCMQFPPGCNCNDASDCPLDMPNCNDCRCTRLPPGCNCETDADCGGGDAKCVACNCQDCPVSVATSAGVINPPLTFVVDTTKSVRPDKFSIFNLTQMVVNRIQEIQANVPSYRLVTFNDFGPDFNQNVELRIDTPDVLAFRQSIIGLRFESFDGGRDSKERMMQGLLAGVQSSPEKSLIVVFTDNGSKDLNLRSEIIRLKNEKEQTVYIVLTPIFEGFPNDPSLPVYEEVSERVFFINEVGADVFLTSVQTFEVTNCV